MGLDSVELILEAEESFGISLHDEEMVEIVTVGQFYDAILRELPHPEKKFCLSAVTFYFSSTLGERFSMGSVVLLGFYGARVLAEVKSWCHAVAFIGLS